MLDGELLHAHGAHFVPMQEMVENQVSQLACKRGRSRLSLTVENEGRWNILAHDRRTASHRPGGQQGIVDAAPDTPPGIGCARTAEEEGEGRAGGSGLPPRLRPAQSVEHIRLLRRHIFCRLEPQSRIPQQHVRAQTAADTSAPYAAARRSAGLIQVRVNCRQHHPHQPRAPRAIAALQGGVKIGAHRTQRRRVRRARAAPQEECQC
mmetsp:Transcript_17390/g.36759  ORF Transcript_17390/g.36759 Transcript_17390/m.36759 type:complete len:207 (+) Transcript_17390:2588-3208(+)